MSPDSTAHTANSHWIKPSSPFLSPLFSLPVRAEASATTAIKSTGSGFLPSWLQENSSYFIHEKRGLWRSKQKKQEVNISWGQLVTGWQVSRTSRRRGRGAGWKHESCFPSSLPAMVGRRITKGKLHPECPHGDPEQKGKNSAGVLQWGSCRESLP